MNTSDLFDPQSPSTGVDYLSKLPAELFGRIYKLAHAETKPSGPLSRALRPFYDELLFHEVMAAPDERAKEFQALLKERPAIGLHVRGLPWEEDANPSDAACDNLVYSFSCMPNLRMLFFYARHGLYLDLFLPLNDATTTIFPTGLTGLMLLLPSDSRDDAYDPQKLTALGGLPHLTKLGLDFCDKYQSPQVIRDEPSELVLSRIDTLSIGLPKVPSSVNALIGVFPHLRRLSVATHQAQPELTSAFASIKQPAGVVELTLNMSPEAGFRLPNELSAFKGLAMLNLAGKLDKLGIDAFQVLQHVPVRTLVLCEHTTISGGVLCGLIESEKLTPKLKTLRLEHLKAVAPDPDEYVIGDPQEVLAQFHLPEWTAAFTFDHLLMSVNLARGRKIATEGSAFEVIGIMAERDVYLDEMGM